MIIAAVVLLNATVGVIQEGKAQKALESLKKLTTRKALVRRDGKLLEMDAAELVPYVFGHRLMLSSRARLNDYTPEAILAQVLEETPAPAMTERTL